MHNERWPSCILVCGILHKVDEIRKAVATNRLLNFILLINPLLSCGKSCKPYTLLRFVRYSGARPFHIRQVPTEMSKSRISLLAQIWSYIARSAMQGHHPSKRKAYQSKLTGLDSQCHHLRLLGSDRRIYPVKNGDSSFRALPCLNNSNFCLRNQVTVPVIYSNKF